ncbi:MAG: transaminase [Caldilineaceae bacterium]
MIDRVHLQHLLTQEEERFRAEHPRSKALFDQAQQSLLGGVPMTWMMKWAGRFPIFMQAAHGARVTDVDGHEYIDLCLGDTGAMPGHSPDATAQAIATQAGRGITAMLPTADAIWVGQELQRRFGLDYWQFTLTATDANRFAIRVAREITERPKILVFNWCYHGTVDETFITLHDGVPGPRPGNVGPSVNPTVTTKVVEFNDLAALEAALAPGDVACVLAEPAMTNIGIVLPQPGFHRTLRELTMRTGTLLIIDETHTMCTGPGGYTAAYHLQPDILTVGKSIGSGMAAAAFGVTKAVAERMFNRAEADYVDTGGVGGTLAGNALSLAAMRATLERVLTADAFAKTIPLAQRFTAGVQAVIAESNLPWHVTQLGCRAEYRFRPTPPCNGGEAAAASDADLDRYMHLFALNRGILMTPFHNMALIAPATTEQDIDYHSEVFRQSVQALLQR